DGDRGLRQVDGEVRHLRDDEHGDLALTERAEEFLPLHVARLALDDGGVQVLPSSSSWSMYWPMTRVCSPLCLRTRASVTLRFVSVVAQKRYFSSVSAVA